MKIEVSTGEVLDKLSILEIKLLHIQDEAKVKNIKVEYEELKLCSADLLQELQVQSLYNILKEVNQQLWDIEDSIRVKEKQNTFDLEFIKLAREVYKTNDRRAEIKKQINLMTNSLLIEEKSYEQY